MIIFGAFLTLLGLFGTYGTLYFYFFNNNNYYNLNFLEN